MPAVFLPFLQAHTLSTQAVKEAGCDCILVSWLHIQEETTVEGRALFILRFLRFI